MECHWIKNTDKTILKLRRASGGVAVLPLASIESHGPHLPLGSDTLSADYIVEQVIARETVAFLPVLPYSYVADARVLPGAIHIRSDRLMDLAENICDEVYRNGFDKIVLLHCHGGNISLHGAFLKRMLEREKPYAIYSVPAVCVNWDELKSTYSSEIGHACEFETGLNMVVCPKLVNLKALGRRTFPSKPAPRVGLAGTPVDWISRHPRMAVGIPQRATPLNGAKVAAMWVDAIVEHLRLIKKDKICPAAMRSYVRRVHSLRRAKTKP